MNERSSNKLVPLLALTAALVIPALMPQSAHGMYDPKHGRWLQRDPVGVTPASRTGRIAPLAQNADSANLHEYVRSSPSGFIDPHGTWTRDTWSETKGRARAERCDTLSELAYNITGKGDDWRVLGISDKIRVGQDVDIVPLLRTLEERLRKSVVAETGNLNATFASNGSIQSLDEAGVRKFFTGGTPALETECFWAYRLVFAMGLIDHLKTGEFDTLKYTPGSIPIRERTGAIETMKIGDRGYIKNYEDYLVKHPMGGYQGENIIMVAKGMYWGFPAGRKSYADWERVLRDAYNEGLSRAEQRTDALPGFLKDEIEFLDVPKIGMNVFDLRERKRKTRP